VVKKGIRINVSHEDLYLLEDLLMNDVNYGPCDTKIRKKEKLIKSICLQTGRAIDRNQVAKKKYFDSLWRENESTV